mgnify:CR=1 FL=1
MATQQTEAKTETGSNEVQATSRLTVKRRPGELSTPLKAVRSKCRDCCAGSRKEVRLCPVTHCALWPYRFGGRKRAKKIVAEERRKQKKLEGETHWAEQLEDYRS